MFETVLINAVLMMIQESVKNPAKKAKLKRYLLPLRDALNMLYPEESMKVKAKAKKNRRPTA